MTLQLMKKHRSAITKLMSYSPEFFETQGALFSWAKDDANSMDANTLEATTSKSTLTIAATDRESI